MLVVRNGNRRKPGKLTPKDAHRFCTVECDGDENHLHLADIKAGGPIHPRCSRIMVGTRVLRFIPLSVWGLLDAGDTESLKYAGRWCRRCLATAMALIGKNSELRFAREIASKD